MATIRIADVVKTLRSERTRTRKKVRQLDKVISALRELPSTNSTPTRNGRRRRMSAARRKIAAAQRKRWAKVHV